MDDEAPPSFTQRCLLPLLQPVRHCLHTFLSAKDAARFMRASCSLTADLLSDYGFVDHVFVFSAAADVKPTIARYGRYHMRITRMCLPFDWSEPLVDSSTGAPLLPRSLTALAVGAADQAATLGQSELTALRRPVVLGELNDKEEIGASREEEGKDGKDGVGQAQLKRITRRWEKDNNCDTWDVPKYSCWSHFNQPIPPGALPHGLRALHLGDNFNRPLQHGSIPDTVEMLKFGDNFQQPIAVGCLPSSLTHLVLGEDYRQQLLPGVLPTGLRRLHSVGVRPLLPGSLPVQLQQLSFGHGFQHPILPGVIPLSVTHIRFSRCFNHSLQPGSIPHGIAHLHLGELFDQPLLPGVLPSSLRQLVVSRQFNQPLQPGSLPDGLQWLAFDKDSRFDLSLQPGDLPDSVVVVSMGEWYKKELVAGSIPASVRWLRLPDEYDADLSSVLMSCTACRIVYWKGWQELL